jgi:hypothetical protein
MEVPASLLQGVEGNTIYNLELGRFDGEVWFDRFARTGTCTPMAEAAQPTIPSGDTVWFDDAMPDGMNGGLGFDTSQKASGTQSLHIGYGPGAFSSGFGNATQPFHVLPGDRLVFYMLMNPCAHPREVKVSWAADGYGWRGVYWGEALIGDESERVSMGPLPTAEGWVRMEVPAHLLPGVEGNGLYNLELGRFDGEVWFDRFGKAAPTTAPDTIPPFVQARAAPQPSHDGWSPAPVSVAFLCIDGETAITTCPAMITVTSDGAGQVVSGVATDTAGNQATATLTLNLDSVPPLLAVNPAPPFTNVLTATLGGTVSDALSGVAGVVCHGTPATVTGSTFSCTVSLFAGTNPIEIVATDKAGNTTTSTVTIVANTRAPGIDDVTPADGFTTSASSTVVSAYVSDDDEIPPTVTIAGLDASASDSRYTTVVPLHDGANAIPIVATDRAGNATTATLTVTRFAVPTIAITSPADLNVLSSPTVEVSGTVSDPAATVEVDGVPASVAGTTFHASGVPLAQGRTVVTAVATSGNGRSATTSINVYRDSIAPRLTVYYPQDLTVVTQSPISVTGMVDDIVVGTINAGQVQVTVNGSPAQVRNRAFLAADIPLTPGNNTLVITATDQAGNAITASYHVTFDTSTTTPKLVTLSGNNQSANIGTLLLTPLSVRVIDGAGTPIANRQVTFKIVENNGQLAAGAVSGRKVTVTTDAQGQASSSWTLGTRAGAGNNRVEVSADGVPAVAEFLAVATTGSPALIVVDSGSNQFGAVSAALARPIVAVVVDRGSNRLAGVPVTFTVVSGGGSFDGQASVTIVTDSDGRAIVRPSLGPDEGADNNIFAASVAGVPDSVASFRASGLIAGAIANTKISGVVVDNTNLPVPGVTLRVDGTSLTTQSDAQGQFVLTNVPIGYVKLFVDGSTAQRPGTWPTLEFALYTVPGQNNTIGMPIYLLPIDVQRGLFVDETHGGTLTLAELPGFSLTIPPGSVTFPGGSRTGTISATLVHPDKMPMPPSFGQQPRFLVTIQPPGAHFDPPAAMSLPNLDGLEPGEITELYSFDHDLGQFVAIGTGSVSDDGSVVRSDPGVGVIKAGWHGGGNPAASGSTSNCSGSSGGTGGGGGQCSVLNAAGNGCVPNPAANGQPCQGNGLPCSVSVCSNGGCVSSPFEVKIGGITSALRNRYVDHDDPSRTWTADSPELAGPVYGNLLSGDNVSWKAWVKAGQASNFRWSATGPETITGPAGAGATEWVVNSINWKPGTYTIKLQATFGGGCVKTDTIEQKVGIRTNDYILYGAVMDLPESTAGVDPLTIDHFECLEAIYRAGAGSIGGFDDPSNTLRAYVRDTEADRVWVVAHLLNLTKDTGPPVPTDLDHPFVTHCCVHVASEAFGVSSSTGYRQAAHAQFKYLVNDDGTIEFPVQRVGEVFAKTGDTPIPCYQNPLLPTSLATVAWDAGVEGDRNDHIEEYPDHKGFSYIMKIQGGPLIEGGNNYLLRRDLSWVFFRFRFDAIDGKIKSNFTHSSDSYDGSDDYDFSAVPFFYLYSRFYSSGAYHSQLLTPFPIQADLLKFLRIAPRWAGAPPGKASYPP